MEDVGWKAESYRKEWNRNRANCPVFTFNMSKFKNVRIHGFIFSAFSQKDFDKFLSVVVPWTIWFGAFSFAFEVLIALVR